ncbi:MAG: hypothetical protein KBB86_03185 [Candidatus Pacebacteria bacterium]|nr:hypothetical protein [Candidatus Paceibacterota bacterium]
MEEPKFNVAVEKDPSLKKRNEAPNRVSDEPITSIEKREEFDIAKYQNEISRELKRYFIGITARDNKNADKMLSLGGNKQGLDTRVLRLPEAAFQNKMLRLVYQNKIALNDNLQNFIKSWLAQEYKEASITKQETVFGLVRGVESTYNAVRALENQTEYPKDRVWIGTNDEMDARYAVDLIQGFENTDGEVETVNLIQVKSAASAEKIEDIIRAHQEYIDSLPTLISVLSKNEATKNSSEVIDEIELEKQEIQDKKLAVLDLKSKSALSDSEKSELERYESEIANLEILKAKQEERLVTFGLILDQFVQDNLSAPDQSVTAQAFIDYYKAESGELNTLLIMGMLSQKETYAKLRESGFTDFDEERMEKILIKTSGAVEFSKEEAVEYYRAHHEHTIIDTASIYSVVMEGSKIVRKTELRHPLGSAK